ncbi:MAG: hypothetical protein VX460_05205 [Planctomycetota bacterium]|nr:hypothetical protein [Planctomycetota bacterium]
MRPRSIAAASRVAAALTALWAASCAAPPEDPDVLERVETRHEADARAYRAAQAWLGAETEFPTALPFDGEGTLIVHRVELLGGPERAYVRARFTYLNSTGRSLPVPTVHLALNGPGGELVETASLRLLRPLGTMYAHDNAYTGWIDVDASAVYRRQGWTWTMDLEVPLPPPLPPPLSARG